MIGVVVLFVSVAAIGAAIVLSELAGSAMNTDPAYADLVLLLFILVGCLFVAAALVTWGPSLAAWLGSRGER